MEQEHTTNKGQEQEKHKVADVFILIALGYWAFSMISNKLLTTFIDDFYNSPVRFVMAFIWIIFAFSPFAFAFGIKHPTRRIVGIILAFMLFAFSMYQQIDYLIFLLKDNWDASGAGF